MIFMHLLRELWLRKMGDWRGRRRNWCNTMHMIPLNRQCWLTLSPMQHSNIIFPHNLSLYLFLLLEKLHFKGEIFGWMFQRICPCVCNMCKCCIHTLFPPIGHLSRVHEVHIQSLTNPHGTGHELLIRDLQMALEDKYLYIKLVSTLLFNWEPAAFCAVALCQMALLCDLQNLQCSLMSSGTAKINVHIYVLLMI